MSNRSLPRTINHTLLPRLAGTGKRTFHFPFPEMVLTTYHQDISADPRAWTKRLAYSQTTVEDMVRLGRAIVRPTVPRMVADLILDCLPERPAKMTSVNGSSSGPESPR